MFPDSNVEIVTASKSKRKMKKNVLFCCYGLGIGGIEKCLVNLINAMPEEEFDIDLLLMNPEYEFLPSIKRRITLLDSSKYTMNTTDTFDEIVESTFSLKRLERMARYVLFRFAVKLRLSPWMLFPAIKKQYDIAVAYSQNDYSPYYVIDKVNSERKILWYHNGSYEKNGWAYRRDSAYYQKFNYIVAVSRDCKKMLAEKFEFAEKKAIVLTNFYDVRYIRLKAEELQLPIFDSDYVNIVTVGRLTAEKGADIALTACESLVHSGRQIRWYWVGDGNQYGNIKKEIALRQLQDSFILMGNKSNPYPYIKAADIYVQPSYYEAYSTTVFEARVLGRVIVATDVGGMREQIDSMKSGVLVPIDANAIASAISLLIDDRRLYQQISSTVKNTTFDSDRNMDIYRERVFE